MGVVRGSIPRESIFFLRDFSFSSFFLWFYYYSLVKLGKCRYETQFSPYESLLNILKINMVRLGVFLRFHIIGLAVSLMTRRID